MADKALQSHRGNCEDYAIVKYVALLQVGLSHEDVRIGILRNVLQKEDHAAVAARVDGQWLILENVRLALVRDMDMIGAIPKFVLDKDSARRFVPQVEPGRGQAPAKRARRNSSGLGLAIVERTRSAAQLGVSMLLKANFSGEGAVVA